MALASPARPQTTAILTRVVDGAVGPVRARLEPRVDELSRSVPRWVRAHAVTITIFVVSVATAGGAIVLWVALLWSVATQIVPYAPAWSTLFVMACAHLVAAGTIAGRLEREAQRPRALPEASPPPERERDHHTRRHHATDRPRRRGRLSSAYRLLLAGLAAGLALERAIR